MKVKLNNKLVSKRYSLQEAAMKGVGAHKYMQNVDIIISTKDTGIANRMKSLASAIRLSMAYGKRFGVIWDTIINIKNQDGSPHRPQSKFSDIFINDFEVHNLLEYPVEKSLLYHTWRLQLFEQDKIPPGFCPHIDKFAPNGVAIDFAYDKIPDRLKREYSNIFKIFELKKNISKKINGFSKRHFNEKTISVHMRTYNDKAGTRGKKKGIYSFELDKFIQKMKEQDDSCNFFVCSDCDETINKVIDVFGDRVITFKSEDRTTEEDVIELYLLSKNNLIIGTKSSTFTEVAWWLSDCKMNVVIV